MKVKKVVLLLVGVTIVFLAGCQFTRLSRPTPMPAQSCTEIGCSDGYTLILQPADTRFPEGRYDVHLTPEGEAKKSCFFVVSNEPDKCASGHCVSAEDCNAIYTVGYKFPDKVRISYPVMELTLTVEVERDDITIAKATFEPIYPTVQPNGPDCSPTCLQGKNVLILE